MIELDAVILASGLSRRMGTNKLLLPFSGTTLVEKFLDSFPFSAFHETIIVVADDAVFSRVDKYPISICFNNCQDEGQSRSVELGLGRSCAKDGVMFFVADQPLLRSATIKKLITKFREYPMSIIVPRVNGKNRNPVIFPHIFREELAALQGDVGGKEVMKKHIKEVVYLDFDDIHEFTDVDTPAQYTSLMELC
jgi:molybdenum cofactor cytidylyltransferase